MLQPQSLLHTVVWFSLFTVQGCPLAAVGRQEDSVVVGEECGPPSALIHEKGGVLALDWPMLGPWLRNRRELPSKQ
jgi:hypothetical protein